MARRKRKRGNTVGKLIFMLIIGAVIVGFVFFLGFVVGTTVTPLAAATSLVGVDGYV